MVNTLFKNLDKLNAYFKAHPDVAAEWERRYIEGIMPKIDEKKVKVHGKGQMET